MASALTLCGSLRRGSFNEVLRRQVDARLATAGVAVTAISLADFPMPVFNEDLEATDTPEAAARLADLFRSHDIVFIASPEYNGGMSPLMVNTLTWLSRQSPNPFKHAVIGIGGVSSGKYGTIWGLSHLRESLTKLGALVVPTLLGVGPAEGAFDAAGAPTEAGINRKLDQLVRELTHFGRGGV